MSTYGNEDILEKTEFKDNTEKETEFDDDVFDEITYVKINNKKIHKERQDKSLKDLNRMVLEDEIILQPDFQREYVWTPKNAISFIESLFLSIPIPTIFVSENEDNKWELIDGQQRLTTIIKFFENKIELKKLSVLHDFNNKKYGDLPEEIKRFFNNITLQVVIIKKETDSEMKYDIFSRLNKGAITLNEQELRNCLYKSEFNKMLKKIAKDIGKDKKLFSNNMIRRMLDVEVILRFYAMRELYFNNFDQYRGLTQQLNHYMSKNKDTKKGQLLKLEEIFFESFKKVDIIFCNDKFKYYDLAKKEYNNLMNRSVMDIQMCILGKYPFEKLEKNKDKIKTEFETAFNNEDFRTSLKIHTNNIEAIKKRFDVMENLIKKIMG